MEKPPAEENNRETKAGETHLLKLPYKLLKDNTIEIHYRDTTFSFRVDRWGKIEYAHRGGRFVDDDVFLEIREEVDSLVRELGLYKPKAPELSVSATPRKNPPPEQFELNL